MNANFLQEMTSVQEALDVWRAGNKIDDLDIENFPTGGVITTDILYEHDRLFGEIAYYRRWQESNEIPIISADVSTEEFNGEFEGELYGIGNKILDLYYLDLNKIGYKSKNTYIIDVQNGLLYQIEGAQIKGVSNVHSLAMYRMITSGEIDAPTFAELGETDGPAGGKKLAGLTDKSDPDYENGFQIIGDYSNDNIYKLYNNGELYAKGIKGNLLNSSEETMSKINKYIWNEITIPSEIPGSSTSEAELISAGETIYVIDKNKDLWAWGDNSNNKLGLTQSRSIEYTGRETVKIDLFGKKVYKLFAGTFANWVVTTSSDGYELYACGYNYDGQLGINSLETNQEAFTKVKFSNPEKIVNITNVRTLKDSYALILDSDGKIYFAGNTTSGYTSLYYIFQNTDLNNTNVKEFTEIFNNKYGSKFANKIVRMYRAGNWNSTFIHLIDDKGNLHLVTGGSQGGQVQEIKFNGEAGNIQDSWSFNGRIIIKRKNSSGNIEYWTYNNEYDEPGLDYFIPNIDGCDFTNVTDIINKWFNVNDIKDIVLNGYSLTGSLFFIMNNGDVYALGTSDFLGINKSSSIQNTIVKLQDVSNISKISKGCDGNIQGMNTIVFLGNDGKYYSTYYSNLIFRENILQKNWIRIASNVKKFNATTCYNSLGYIDNNNDLWILGNDTRYLGINSTEPTQIKNFKPLKDYLLPLKNSGVSNIYDNINGKVEDYRFDPYGGLYIKTNESDNDTVYVCGLASQFTGIGADKNAYIPTKVIDNVNVFCKCSKMNMCLLNNGQMWAWGGTGGGNGVPVNSPTPVKMESDVLYQDEIKKIYLFGWVYYIVQKDHFIMTGLSDGGNVYCNGYGTALRNWINLDLNTYFDGKQISKVVGCQITNNYLLLSENGDLYGAGIKRTLGINSQSQEFQEPFLKIPKFVGEDDPIVDIAAGKDYYLAITKSGRVYGTGSNTYGILGRWKGAPRSSGRYRTAFEWVECPELEL